MSRSLDKNLAAKFGAKVCIEVQQVRRFCDRIQTSLPAGAAFVAGRVTYYDQRDGPDSRWALPDEIVMSKRNKYAWQSEFRIAFCLTDALREKASYRVVKGNLQEPPKRPERRQYSLTTGGLGDLCRIHEQF